MGISQVLSSCHWFIPLHSSDIQAHLLLQHLSAGLGIFVCTPLSEETLTEGRTFLHLGWTQQLPRCKYNLGWRKEETLALPCPQVQAKPQDLPASVLLASCPDERDRRNGPGHLSLLLHLSEPTHYSVLVLAQVSEQAHMSTSVRLAPCICS